MRAVPDDPVLALDAALAQQPHRVERELVALAPGQRANPEHPQASTLRLALAVVLIGSGLALLSKAGAAIPPAVIAAVPVLLGALVIWKERSVRVRARPRAPVAVAD